VTKPLVYQHFASKRALYLELVDAVARDLMAAVADATVRAEGPRQQVELGFAAYFTFVVAHDEAFRLLYGRNDSEDPNWVTPSDAWKTPWPRPSTPSSPRASTPSTAAPWPTPSSGWPRARAGTGSPPATSRAS